MLHYYYSRYYLTIIFGSVFGLIYRFYDPGCLVIFHFFLFLIYSCSFLYVPVLIIFLSYFFNLLLWVAFLFEFAITNNCCICDW
jgi:hypothetical protein